MVTAKGGKEDCSPPKADNIPKQAPALTGGCSQAPASSCIWGAWKTLAGFLDESQNVNLIFCLLALVALCHADLTVKHRFVCLLSTCGKMGKALLFSWLKAFN